MISISIQTNKLDVQWMITQQILQQIYYNNIEMNNKNKQYEKLDNDQINQHEWIQMTEMGANKNINSSTSQNETDFNRKPSIKNKISDRSNDASTGRKLVSQDEFSIPLNKNSSGTQPKKPNPQNPNKSKTQSQPPQNPSTIPTHQSSLEPAPRLKAPQMKVACQYCTLEQMVPGYTSVYVCYCCNNRNTCFPLYGIYRCGICRERVVYPYGTSQFIRCVVCNTISSVQTEPHLEEDTCMIQGQRNGQINQKGRREIEEQILIHEDDEPVRPKKNKKSKEQLIDEQIKSQQLDEENSQL